MKIKFVSYDGSYPTLCMGLLVMDINGKRYHFGNPYINKTECELYPVFWVSTGGIAYNDDYSDMWAIGGDWALDMEEDDLKDYPEEIRDIEIFKKMIELMNENTKETPCCGGCI